MSWMYGEDYAYAATRLDGTLVTHNSLPFFVERIRMDGTAEGYYPSNEEKGVVSVEANTLDLRPVRLGYLNQDGLAAYISRMPMRRDWRQGLRHLSMVCADGVMNKDRVRFLELSNTILGIFPTFAEACTAISTNCKSMAWARHWALNDRGCVMYKGENVGVISNGLPSLSPKYSHLKEYLKEVM